MVEYSFTLDSIFGALSDGTRRDILDRVSMKAMSISEVAEPYELTFAAISKHLKVLEKAKLIVKRRSGKEQIVKAAPGALVDVDDYLKHYQQLWESRLDSLETYLKEEDHGKYS